MGFLNGDFGKLDNDNLTCNQIVVQSGENLSLLWVYRYIYGSRVKEMKETK